MNVDACAEYTARSNIALQALGNERQVRLRRFPDGVLRTLRERSEDVRADIAAKDATTKKVYLAYENFRKQVTGWTEVSEYAFLQART